MRSLPPRRIRLTRPLDLRRTLGPLRRGAGDRCTILGDGWVWRATRTPDGPATMHLDCAPGGTELTASAWGPGAAWVLEHAEAISGAADDDGGAFTALLARHGGGAGRDLLRRLHRQMPGLRIPATHAVTEAIVPSVIEQKVTGLQARRSYQQLVRRLGEAAPGPPGGPVMVVPPPPSVWASTPIWVFHRAGVEHKRAATLALACTYAHRLDPVAADADLVRRRMAALPGIGAWTVAEVARVALGDADAVSVGDYHLKNMVSWALAGRARGSDDEMVELLEDYRGHRGRVTRLLEAGGQLAPRFGPKLTIQPISAI